MRTMVGKFRKKPVVIEAWQWHRGDAGMSALAEWMGEAFGEVVGDKMIVHTLEGPVTSTAGDYIIKGVAGEFYSCREDIFLATYDHEPEG